MARAARSTPPPFTLVALTLAACPATGDSDDAACPAALRFESTSGECSGDACPCEETFCAPPQVWPAKGSGERFRVLSDGDALPIERGPAGGYLVELGFASTNLCPVTYVDFALWDVTGGGETLVTATFRHVRAERVPQGEPPSEQRWWGEQLRPPCAYWPDDPDASFTCADPPIAPLETLDLELHVLVRDHNEDRVAAAVVRVDPTFGE